MKEKPPAEDWLQVFQAEELEVVLLTQTHLRRLVLYREPSTPRSDDKIVEVRRVRPLADLSLDLQRVVRDNLHCWRIPSISLRGDSFLENIADFVRGWILRGSVGYD